MMNYRETLSCADCKHLNVVLRHFEQGKPYAVRCDRLKRVEYELDNILMSYLYICDGFESKQTKK